jgi:hypothetical protein
VSGALIQIATGARLHAIGAAQIEPEGRAVLLVVHSYERTIMAKKSSASSQPARLKSTRSEDIGNRQCSEKWREALRRIAGRQAAMDDSAH